MDGQQLLECHRGSQEVCGTLVLCSTQAVSVVGLNFLVCTHIPTADFSHQQCLDAFLWDALCPQGALFSCHITRSPAPPHHQPAVGLPPSLGIRLGVLTCSPLPASPGFWAPGKRLGARTSGRHGRFEGGCPETSSAEVK